MAIDKVLRGIPFLRQELTKLFMKRAAKKSGIMQIPFKNKDLQLDIEDRVQKYINDAQKQGVDLDMVSNQNLKYTINLNENVDPISRAISADSPEGRKITEALLGKQKAPVVDINTGKTMDTSQGIIGGKSVKELMEKTDAQIKAEIEANNKKSLSKMETNNFSLNTITKIKSMKPMDAMKEANLVAGKKGRYANLDDNQVKKIIDDTNDHIFERDIPIDPEDMAKGGRAGYGLGSMVTPVQNYAMSDNSILGPAAKNAASNIMEGQARNQAALNIFNQSTPKVDARMNLDYDTLINQNEAQRNLQAQQRNPGIMRPTIADVAGPTATQDSNSVPVGTRIISDGRNRYAVRPNGSLSFINTVTPNEKDYINNFNKGPIEGYKFIGNQKYNDPSVGLNLSGDFLEFTGYGDERKGDGNFKYLQDIDQTDMPRAITQDDIDTFNFTKSDPMMTGFDYSKEINWSPGQPAPDGYRVAEMMGDTYLERMYPSKEEVAGLPGMVGPMGLMRPEDFDNYANNFQQDPDAGLSGQEIAEKYGIEYAQGGRAGYYTGGMVDVEPNLSDIGHGSDALMARTRLVSPDGQATTSTGLNYLLAEDNDNLRVPFENGGDMQSKIDEMIGHYQRYLKMPGKQKRKIPLKKFAEMFATENFAEGGRTGFAGGGSDRMPTDYEKFLMQKKLREMHDFQNYMKNKDIEKRKHKFFEMNSGTGPGPTLEAAEGGRIGFANGNGVADEDAEKAALGKRVRELMDDGFDFGEAVKQAMSEGYAEGGRIGFSKGKIAKEVADKGRRGFMKAAGATGAGIAALKTGLLGFGEKAAPVAKEVIETVSETAQGVPPYFLNLVNKIRKMGESTLATKDKANAYKFKDYVMEEDFAGNIEIIKKGNDVAEDVYMSYKVDDVPVKKGGSSKVEEYEEFTARPDAEGKMKDIEQGVPDEVVQEGTMFKDNFTDFGKADGGIARMIGE